MWVGGWVGGDGWCGVAAQRSARGSVVGAPLGSVRQCPPAPHHPSHTHSSPANTCPPPSPQHTHKRTHTHTCRYLKRAYWPFPWSSPGGGFEGAARTFLEGEASADMQACGGWVGAWVGGWVGGWRWGGGVLQAGEGRARALASGASLDALGGQDGGTPRPAWSARLGPAVCSRRCDAPLGSPPAAVRWPGLSPCPHALPGAQAINRTARHRLERGIFTSPGAGDIRRAVVACERLARKGGWCVGGWGGWVGGGLKHIGTGRAAAGSPAREAHGAPKRQLC